MLLQGHIILKNSTVYSESEQKRHLTKIVFDFTDTLSRSQVRNPGPNFENCSYSYNTTVLKFFILNGRRFQQKQELTIFKICIYYVEQSSLLNSFIFHSKRKQFDLALFILTFRLEDENMKEKKKEMGSIDCGVCLHAWGK